jgi:hypothetical protein
MGTSAIQVKIGFVDENWDQEAREVAAQNLLRSLKDLDELESVGRVPEIAPEGTKGLGFVAGLLTAEVSKENAKKLLGFLSDRLSGKMIEMEVEANGEKLKVKARSREEMKDIIAEAERFINREN